VRTEDGYIIYRCLNGDSTAFGFLVDKYKEGVYAFAYERLHNFHDAEDVAQEVFLKAYRSLRTLRRWDSFASWLYRITLNLCRGRFRTQSSRPDREFIEDQEPELLENHSRDLYRQELVCESVREALDSLPEMYSQVLTLHYLSGMTSMEIARFTGVSPSAIRKRLSKARSLLKEEMLAMMSTTFEEQKLPSTFTLRIVEAVRKMKIQPMPRTAGLPWGLSLATGIVLAILNFSPYPGILNRAATGSPLPGETKVLRIGEIPVDILRFSEVPVLASKQGDGDGGEPGSSATLAAAHDEENVRAQEIASNQKVITDPETGVKYTKIETLTGKRDVIRSNTGLNLSPNGKFLLWGQLVIPVDDGDPFELVDMVTGNSAWSPNGQKVAFYANDSIWLLPVSPETGRATGPAKKLLDGEHRGQLSWSPDSERIAFEWRDKDSRGDIWTLSVRDGKLTQITSDKAPEYGPIWSPDGKTIAYSKNGVRVVPAEGGTSRKIIDRYDSAFWSSDSEWLAYITGGGLRFFHLADGREFGISPPDEVGGFFAWSPDGKKMLFYRPSYGGKSSLKVVSVSGGSSFEPAKQLPIWAYIQFWSPDSKMIVTRDDRCFWAIPLAGGEPFPLELDVSVEGEPYIYSISPDCRRLLFGVPRSDGTEDVDLWAATVSLKDGRITDPATLVFSAWDRRNAYALSWSPDGTKLAVIHEWDLWIASTDGREPVRITETTGTGAESQPVWSPNGKMIAYLLYPSAGKAFPQVIPASGGEPRKMLDVPGNYITRYAWSPDSKELAVVSEDNVILSIPIAGGSPRQIANLKDLEVDYVWGLCWSPDGHALGLIGFREDGGRIFIIPIEEGQVKILAADDPGKKAYLYWSPDGKWLSYNSDVWVKTRPGGEIWEADVSELLSGMEKEQ
jgi:RNA polymerase sigma factor (sigma-70 family)